MRSTAWIIVSITSLQVTPKKIKFNVMPVKEPTIFTHHSIEFTGRTRWGVSQRLLKDPLSVQQGECFSLWIYPFNCELLFLWIFCWVWLCFSFEISLVNLHRKKEKKELTNFIIPNKFLNLFFGLSLKVIFSYGMKQTTHIFKW